MAMPVTIEVEVQPGGFVQVPLAVNVWTLLPIVAHAAPS
jgi:hypothetical protein